MIQSCNDPHIPDMTQQNSLQTQNARGGGGGNKKMQRGEGGGKLECAAYSVISAQMLSCGRDRVKDVHRREVDEISHNRSHNSSSMT